MDSGAYANSCKDCTVINGGGTLKCTCRSTWNGWQDSSLDLGMYISPSPSHSHPFLFPQKPTYKTKIPSLTPLNRRAHHQPKRRPQIRHPRPPLPSLQHLPNPSPNRLLLRPQTRKLLLLRKRLRHHTHTRHFPRLRRQFQSYGWCAARLLCVSLACGGRSVEWVPECEFGGAEWGLGGGGL